MPPARAPKPMAAAPVASAPAEVATEAPSEAPRESTVAAAPATSPAPVPAPAAPKTTEPAPKPSPAAKPSAAATSPGGSDARRAQALLEGKASEAEPARKEAGRYVVQVGAFSDTAAARETRQKVEKLGLKTYTQVAETSQGSRIRVRVGPFTSREEADRAQARIKAAGTQAVVLTL
jgi:DedD protein